MSTGTTRLERAFERTRSENRAALVLFITAGDPDLETTAELIPELAAAGADVIELGVPHSDPIGEGPSVQASSGRSLAHKTQLGQILELAGRTREACDVPLVLMGYLNNVLAHGPERLARDCVGAGIDGLILADTPFDEAPQLSHALEAEGIHRIALVAPTSTPERVVRLAGRATGFVYCVSFTGVTGVRSAVAGNLGELVGRIRRVTSTPVCVGFGVSTRAQAAEVARIADGVIVGSALVNRIGGAATPAEAIRAAAAFTAELSAAIRSARG